MEGVSTNMHVHLCAYVTIRNVKFAECFYVYRVYSLGHSTNK